MLKGMNVGIDIINVERFEKKHYDENKMFYKKIFNESEIKYCLKYKNPYPYFAAKFSLKEAVKKSIKENVSMLDIQSDHKSSKPIIKIKNKSNYEFLISLSHEKEFAIAVVISFNNSE
jgi:holo-[acyl-carrier protein] synthase